MSHFGDRLRYGDECPICERGEVRAVVESGPGDGPRIYNGECSQHDCETGHSRFIFHIGGPQ